jgi:hypothetical protein
MQKIRTLLMATLCATGIPLAALPAVAQTTERVSVSSTGDQANRPTQSPRISADGRFVTFASFATNLVAGDTNGSQDIFVHDRESGTTSRVSVASDGTQGSGFSPSISADGRFVAFLSWASNLVPGDTNNTADVFLRDRQNGTTIRVSVASDGTQANSDSDGASISADGRFVAFTSYASNLVAGDTNDGADVFVHDRQSGTTTRVSIASDGTQGNSRSHATSISADGRFVAFFSFASNLVAGDTNAVPDAFVHDRQTGTTSRVSVASDGTQGNNITYFSSISADGRFVAFFSEASNLVAGDTNEIHDVFVHDRQSGTTSRVSIASDGMQGNDESYDPSISADGRFVAFNSAASNLVAGDTNGPDVFVHDRGPQEVITFLGFERPIQDLPFTNSAKAGRSIPIKWQLTDEAGGYIRDLAIVKSLQFAEVACDSQDVDYENPIGAPAVGASRLRYDRADEHFIYNWKTQRSMRNTCAVFILTLADNQQHFARFMLK